MFYEKRISFILVLIFIFSSFSAYAMKPTINAYSNLETAIPKEKEEIIKARKEIVYGEQSWTVNGQIFIFKDCIFGI